MGSLEVTLASGVRRDGAPRREALVRSLSFDEERGLVDDALSLLPAELVTRLLGRCAAVGGEAGSELASELTIGDRAALLLSFHRLTAGDALPCLVDCAACGERFALELDAASLLVERDPVEPLLETDVRGTRISFRLPTGADEERAARSALADPVAAADELLRACVVDDGGARSDELAVAVDAAIAESDPHAEIVLTFTCLGCGAVSASVLEPASYVLDELQARTAEVEHEVHALASRYGWSEAEILSLPGPRRRRYLQLIEAGDAR